VAIRERLPGAVSTVEGEPWLAASDGTLLEPLRDAGDFPELPRLVGLPPGAEARSAAIRRGVAAVRALERDAGDLLREIQSVDLSDAERTTVRLSGTPWPLWLDPRAPRRNLAAYAALRGRLSQETSPAGVDLRWKGRIAVRPRTVESGS
jgi:hypothetical protein